MKGCTRKDAPEPRNSGEVGVGEGQQGAQTCTFPCSSGDLCLFHNGLGFIAVCVTALFLMFYPANPLWWGQQGRVYAASFHWNQMLAFLWCNFWILIQLQIFIYLWLFRLC